MCTKWTLCLLYRSDMVLQRNLDQDQYFSNSVLEGHQPNLGDNCPHAWCHGVLDWDERTGVMPRLQCNSCHHFLTVGAKPSLTGAATCTTVLIMMIRSRSPDSAGRLELARPTSGKGPRTAGAVTYDHLTAEPAAARHSQAQ
eukprot:g12220.t1